MRTPIADAATVNVSWHKSRHSGANSDCVETGLLGTGTSTVVRDSKAAHGPALAFNPSTWSTFLTAVKEDAFPASR
ncbi:DUF397 domain-containing protein [Streptomyces sp. NPDC018000]|uniref:DUF397 domain-containing protein n=1 Tax=Streptomyces sp. NPDC018000 TaxID=3365028 RepID=UPI0037A74364